MKNNRKILGALILVVLILAAGFYLWQKYYSAGQGGDDNAGDNQRNGGNAATEVINISLEPVAQNLASPVALLSANDDSGRLFVADQIGLIRIINQDGALTEEPFLDLRGKLTRLNAAYDERGLLGLAFHPDFKNNGRFYVYYSAPLKDGALAGWDHTSRVSEYTVSAGDPSRADANSEKIILQVDQPQSNHNAGQIAFGPDGFLYVPLGDGGGANDTGLGHVAGGNAQDTSSLLGSILRLDVDAGDPYAIPADNPFAAGGGRGEIFAYGFRNPFHISFDAGGDRTLIAGDAGQNLWEEIDLVKKGGNYGWNIKEGRHCFDPDNPNVSPDACASPAENLIDPVVEYKNIKQGGGLGAVVVGGYVYRGGAIPGLQGKYIFGDWSRSFAAADGTILAADRQGDNWPFMELKIDGLPGGRLGEFLLGFGQDADNELYVLTASRSGPSGGSGKVYRLMPGAGEVQININNFSFTPQVVAAKAGAKIKWLNQDNIMHTIIAEGLFDSGQLEPGASYELILSEPGNYEYYCAPHPFMTGTIVID
ncbi:MAG: PQQ-dependent sugar dehydrogenase [bacterium]|nr:PQQ-dependent sugar dehydrogenase [bacterium]